MNEKISTLISEHQSPFSLDFPCIGHFTCFHQNEQIKSAETTVEERPSDYNLHHLWNYVYAESLHDSLWVKIP